jgi:hypothetical protein
MARVIGLGNVPVMFGSIDAPLHLFHAVDLANNARPSQRGALYLTKSYAKYNTQRLLSCKIYGNSPNMDSNAESIFNNPSSSR